MVLVVKYYKVEKINFRKFKKLLPGLKKNVLLKNYTSFKIGGRAKYFFVAKNKEEIIKAISVAKKIKLPFFILGGGSNILVSDRGFDGLVIKIQNSKFKIQNSKIIAEAGVLLSQLINCALKNSLTGLEWAAGIPGTIGGAIYGNAGAFGKSIGDLIKEVEVLEMRKGKYKVRKYKKRNCKFNYRESIFKRKPDLTILSAEIQLKRGKKSAIQRKMKEYLDYRKKTQPLNFPSAGSVFKNPSPSQVLKKFGRARGFLAAELIEKCNLKGKRIENVKISEKHANFIINLGNGRAKDVKKLIKIAKQKVKKKFKILLEEEIKYLGFKN